MRYFISSNLPMNWEKYVFHWQKWDFELILNSLHIAELLALYYASRQHVKPNHFKCKFPFSSGVCPYLMSFSSILIEGNLVSNREQNMLYTKT